MRKYLFLIAILLLAFFLYFYKLDKIPSGVYVDEASIAYNTYSVLLTGKDEYGFAHPLYFRLMGSYSPSFFIYLSLPIIKVFGTNVLIFRVITSAASIVGVFLFYKFLIKLNIFNNKSFNLVLTYLYAISPWIVFNARLGYETTLGFVIFNIGVYFLYLSVEIPKNLIWSILFLSLSTYVSHNQRFLVPIFLLGFFIAFRKPIFKKSNTKYIRQFVILGFLTQLPNILMLGTKAFWIKSAQFNPNLFWQFLTYLSPKTLFFQNPDIDLQHTIPKLSVMYNWMAIPYLVGFYLLFKNIKKTQYKFIFMYLALSLIPSIFSSIFVSTQRVMPAAIPIFLIIGLGIDQISKKLKPKLALALFILLSVYSLTVLYSSYFVLFPKERANAWQYGYDQVAQFIKEHQGKKFLLDDSRNPRAYILLLYHLKYSPAIYQNEVGEYYRNNYYSAPDPALVYKFSNIEVRKIDWEKDSKKELVIIGDEFSISENQQKEHNLEMIKQISDPLGNTIFKIYN